MKILKKALTIFSVTAAAVLLSVPASAAVWGDADGDGKVTATDAAIVLQKAIDDSYVISDAAAYLCNVDCDGRLTASDSALILQKAIDDSFVMPCQTNDPTTDTTETTTETTTDTTTDITTETTTETTTEITTEASTETTTLDPNGIVVNSLNALNSAVSTQKNKGGGIVYVNGDINCSSQIKLSSKKANVSIVGIVDENGKMPVLDFSGAGKVGGSATGIYVSGSYYNFENLIIQNAPNCGMRITGDGSGHCNITNCVFRYNGNSGVAVTYGGEYNSFKNCYSYRNCDIHNGGSDADGFAIKLTPGKGNSFYGCMAWENGDDGWDSYAMPYDVTYEECACWNNGNYEAFTGQLDFKEGNALDKNLICVKALIAKDPDFEAKYNAALANGTSLEWPSSITISTASGSKSVSSGTWKGNPNGFKYGSYATNHENGQVEATAYRSIKNCLAFNHGGKGFDQNNCYASFDMENTLGFDNGWKNTKPNYYMERMTCLSCKNAVGFGGTVADLLPAGMTVTEPDEQTQQLLREKVAKTRALVLERVYSNTSPGEILFDVYG